MTQTNKRLNVVVTGKVQGVSFRASTRQIARQIGLSGWVRNLKTGEVELEAQGTDEQLSTLLRWLENGPEYARVTGLNATDVPPITVASGFNILEDN